MEKIFLVLIKWYRYLVRPCFGPSCRFYPSCSQYAESAIQEWGWWKGAELSLCRVLKCHPWHVGGFDPVPIPSTRLKDC